MSHNFLYRHFISVLVTLCCTASAFAYVPTYYTANSKLSSGHWVKVKVTEIGMHEISYDQLRELGFDKPENVCVYGYGGTRLTKNTFDSTFPDDLPVQPVYYGDDKLIFYGEPDLRVNLGSNSYKVEVLRNVYSTAGYYFLSDYKPSSSVIPSSINYNLSNILLREYHNCILYHENEVENPGKASSFFFDKSLIDNACQTHSFVTPKPYKPAGEAAGMRYGFAAKVPSYTSLNVDFSHPDSIVKANHRTVIPSSLASQYYYTSDGELTFNMNETDSVYSFTFSLPASAKADYAALDYVYLSYRRQNDFENESQLRMSFLQVNQNTNFKITNANKNIQVWNVTNPLNIYPHATKFTESTKSMVGSFEKTYTFSSTGNACLVAFDPTKSLHKVEVVGKVGNQNLHSLEPPHMVIITNDLCKPYAEKVAQAHRDHQGFDVLVIDHKHIFNEFSSGTPSAMAYRRFVKMLYDRGPSKFKYLLLFGEGSWDNRGLIYPKDDRLLTYQAEIVDDARSAAKAFCGDSYFGMINDSYDPETFYNNEAQIAVGRIPATTAANAQAATNKIISYLQNPPSSAVFNRALFIADEGDSYGHVIQQEENVDSLLNRAPATTCTRVYSLLYPSTDNNATEASDMITRSLNHGQGFFSFAGHGGSTYFTGKKIWSISHIKGTSYNHPPIAMLATCDAFAFDRSDGGMAEQALYKENGGFIAIVAASRTVYMQFNQYINRAFTCELYSANEGDLIGDVFRRARNKAATTIVDRTLGVNTMCYNLAGDPALPLYKPSLTVATSTINGNNVSDTSVPPISPLSKNIITGEITDENGQLHDSFNGSVTLSIFDGPIAYCAKTNEYKEVIVTVVDSTFTAPAKSACATDSVTLLLDEAMLSEVTVPVVNGKFEATLITPTPQKTNSINRITYFAINNDGTKRASGNFNYVTITPYNSSTAITDATAPSIEQCYINDISFENGDVVSGDFIYYATIGADESGINVVAPALGSGITLTLDDNKTFPNAGTALTQNADGTASLSFHFNDIDDGQHSLTLSIADNAGNRSSHTIHFTVINSAAQATLSVDETPARTQATFNISHNFAEEPTGRLVIEDSNRTTIFSKTACSFPFTWDLKDNNGNIATDGNYKAYVILNGGSQYGSTPKTPLVIIK